MQPPLGFTVVSKTSKQTLQTAHLATHCPQLTRRPIQNALPHRLLEKAEARRHDLGYIASTRALYLAGEDGQGRQLVVFSPDLVLGLPVPSLIDCTSRARGRKDSCSHAMSEHEPYSSCTCRDSGNEGCVVGSTSASVSVPAAVATDRTGGGAGAGSGAGAGRGLSGSTVAGEQNVGSSAVASLLLYFVRLMDNVADRKYVVLLCAGGGGRSVGEQSAAAAAAAAGGLGTDAAGTGGGAGGWVTWGRFSLLGQMHSLLPRR